MQAGANQLLQFGRISLGPAKDGYVVHLNAAVRQHAFGITVPQVGTAHDREIDHAVPVLDLNTIAAAELFDVHDESLSASTFALRI